MGNTLFRGHGNAFRANGFVIHRIYPVLFLVKEACIIMYVADKPDIVSDFSDADMLVTEHGTQVDLAVTHTDPVTLGYPGYAMLHCAGQLQTDS